MLLHDAECPYWEQAQVDNILKLKVYVEKLINIAIPISPWKKLNIVMTMHCSTFCFPHILRPSKYMLIYQSQLLRKKKNISKASHLICYMRIVCHGYNNHQLCRRNIGWDTFAHLGCCAAITVLWKFAN